MEILTPILICGHHRPAGRRHSGGGLHRHGGAQGRKGPKPWRRSCPGPTAAPAGFPAARATRRPWPRARAQPGLCSPGGAEVAQKCAEILGGGDVQVEYKTALVHCLGSYDNTTDKMLYDGIQSCSGGGLPHGGRHQLPFWLHGPGGLPAGLPVRRHHRVQRPGPHWTRPSARAAPSAWRPAPRGLSLWCP